MILGAAACKCPDVASVCSSISQNSAINVVGVYGRRSSSLKPVNACFLVGIDPPAHPGVSYAVGSVLDPNVHGDDY